MSRASAAVRAFAGHWPTLVAGVAVLLAGRPWIAAAWCAASRLAYVLFVGLSLRAEDRRDAAGGRESAWAIFSRRASWLMDNDAVAFVTLCLVSAGTLSPSVSPTVAVAAGSLLIVLGLGVKIWAAATLSAGSYHWRNFFHPGEAYAHSAGGPYRFLSNPMYTVGYAHAYGVALVLRSFQGLIAAAASQGAILLLHVLVERPHLRRVRERGQAGDAVTPRGAPPGSRAGRG